MSTKHFVRIEVANYAALPLTGENNVLYQTADTELYYMFVNGVWRLIGESDFSGDYNDLLNLPVFATVATTGSYNDLLDLPGAPVPSDPPVATTYYVDCATVVALPTNTYYNGIANDGVGATITANSNGALGNIDNFPTQVGTRILVRTESATLKNGVYEVTQVGDGSNPFILTRTVEADENAELYPFRVNVLNGSLQKDRDYFQSNVSVNVGVTAVTFTNYAIPNVPYPVQHVATVTSAPLPSSTYTIGTQYPVQIPGYGAILEANAVGALGTINGRLIKSGDIILVKDEVNPIYNGDYIVLATGSATTKWKLRRVSAVATTLTPYFREWKVNNVDSTEYGKRYSLDNTYITNTNIGISANLNFTEAPAGSTSGQFGIADSNGVYTYYTTLTLAMTAAVSGQTIEFFTDYTETGAVTITLKDGVTINGNGHTYTLNVANDTTHAMLIDTSGTFRINNLQVRRINGTGSSTQALRITALGAINVELYGDGSFFYCSTGMGVFTPQATVNMYNIFAQTDAASQYCIYSEGNIYKSIGRGAGIGIGNYSGKVYDSVGVSSGNRGMEVAVAYNCSGISSANVGIYIVVLVAVTGYLSNCTGISSSNVGITVNKANSIVTNCSCYSASNSGINLLVASTFQNSTAYSSSYWGLYSNGAKVNNCTLYSSTSYALYAESGSIVSNNVIESNGLHAAFLDASTNNAAQLMNNTFIVGNAAYNCLNATSAITLKYANNAFKGATTPVNANITQGVSNTHDSQGNILI